VWKRSLSAITCCEDDNLWHFQDQNNQKPALRIVIIETPIPETLNVHLLYLYKLDCQVCTIAHVVLSSQFVSQRLVDHNYKQQQFLLGMLYDAELQPQKVALGIHTMHTGLTNFFWRSSRHLDTDKISINF